MNRILVIRGGAIGDFVLTLPAIKLLRDRFPRAHIEILGYPQIVALAENRFYADATRSLESSSFATFFVKDALLPSELKDFFGSFDLIVSYLSDPENIFRENLERSGMRKLLLGPPKPGDHEHAAIQLARPLEQIGLYLQDLGATIYPNDSDRAFARDFLQAAGKKVAAFHPGSGSESKNWPIEKWKQLGEHFHSTGWTLIVVAGEADKEQARSLEDAWKGGPVRLARDLPLPHLAAVLEGSLFVGHDSGVSHIAGAVGARSILLFGQTDPAIWAPANKRVTILRAPQGDLGLLTFENVIEVLGG